MSAVDGVLPKGLFVAAVFLTVMKVVSVTTHQFIKNQMSLLGPNVPRAPGTSPHSSFATPEEPATARARAPWLGLHLRFTMIRTFCTVAISRSWML